VSHSSQKPRPQRAPSSAERVVRGEITTKQYISTLREGATKTAGTPPATKPAKRP
jgi:hypothetical protein